MALLIAMLTAIPLGIVSAMSPTTSRRSSDRSASISPDLLDGGRLILLVTSTLGWLPPCGYVSPTEDPLGWPEHIILPAVTLGIVSGSVLTRFVRSSVLESLS